MTAERLLAHYEEIADAPDAIARLRRFILDLGVRGKLVPQDRNDEPASALLKRIVAEKGGESSRAHEERAEPDADLAVSIPGTWAWSQLGEISLRLHYGYTAAATDAEKEVRLLRITDIQEDRVDWTRVPGCEIDAGTFRKYALEPGDLLIARTGGTIGKTFLVSHVPVKSVFASYLIRVQPARSLFANYIKLFCGSDVYWSQLRDGSRGGGQPNVNGKTLGKMRLPLPPLAEQHRIVAKVDELMALCDRLEATQRAREAMRDRLATASLTRLNTPDPNTFQADARFALSALPALTARPDQIKQFRKTVISLAVRGQLIPQNPNDEPAVELLKRIAAKKLQLVKLREIKLREVGARKREEPRDLRLPSGWALTDLGSVSFKITDGAHKTPTYVEKGIPFVSVKDFSAGKLNLDNTRFIPEAEHEVLYKRCDPRRGDILIGRIGTLGKAVVVDTDIEFSLFVSVGLIRFDHENLLPNFFRLVLNSPFVEAEFNQIKIGGGTHTNKLNLGDLHTVALPLPPLAEQHRIVAKVDALMALCDRLEASLTTAAASRRRLLDALLAGALAPTGTREMEAAE